MPIVVDEVVISVEVDSRAPAAPAGSASAPGSDDRQSLVAECVDRVLEILAQREER